MVVRGHYNSGLDILSVSRYNDKLSRVVKVDTGSLIYRVHAAERTYTCSQLPLNMHVHTCTHAGTSLLHDEFHFLQDVLCKNPKQLVISRDSLIINIQLIWTGHKNISQVSSQL